MNENLILWADLIERFLAEKTSRYEWDDYLHIKTSSPLTEKIRGICGEMSFLFPSSGQYCSKEGEDHLKDLARVLRKSPEEASEWVDAFTRKFMLGSK